MPNQPSPFRQMESHLHHKPTSYPENQLSASLSLNAIFTTNGLEHETKFVTSRLYDVKLIVTTTAEGYGMCMAHVGSWVFDEGACISGRNMLASLRNVQLTLGSGRVCTGTCRRVNIPVLTRLDRRSPARRVSRGANGNMLTFTVIGSNLIVQTRIRSKMNLILFRHDEIHAIIRDKNTVSFR